MGTDFFDDDLSKRGDADQDQRAGTDKAGADAASGRLAKHKEELIAKTADSGNEIERLRRRQEELVKEKSELEGLTRKQEEYERGKRDMIEKLDRSLILIEKEEIQAAQMAEILSSTRIKFKETLDGLRQIDEERWADDAFTTELNRALTHIEDARDIYKKGLAKIEAARWQETGAKKGESVVFDRGGVQYVNTASFGYWLKVGLAVTLPLVVVAAAIFIIYLIVAKPL